MRDTDVIERIKELCAARGWSFYMLAKKAEIPYSTINNMIHRNTVPTVSTIQRMCDGFDITLSYFFCGSGPARNGSMAKINEPELRSGVKNEGTVLIKAYAKGLDLTEVV